MRNDLIPDLQQIASKPQIFGVASAICREAAAALSAQGGTALLPQEEQRQAIIEVDRIESRHSLTNEGDVPIRIRRIGDALKAAQGEAAPSTYLLQVPMNERRGIDPVECRYRCLYTQVKPCREIYTDPDFWCSFCSGTSPIQPLTVFRETATAPVDESQPELVEMMAAIGRTLTAASAIPALIALRRDAEIVSLARQLGKDGQLLMCSLPKAAASPLPPGEGLAQLAREIHREISYDEAAACERAEDDKEPCITCDSILAALTRARAQGQPEPQP